MCLRRSNIVGLKGKKAKPIATTLNFPNENNEIKTFPDFTKKKFRLQKLFGWEEAHTLDGEHFKVNHFRLQYKIRQRDHHAYLETNIERSKMSVYVEQM